MCSQGTSVFYAIFVTSNAVFQCLPIRSKLSSCCHAAKLFALTIFMFRENERIYLSKRKGFVKVAMQAGADIVPVYILGQSQVRLTITPSVACNVNRHISCSRTHISMTTTKLLAVSVLGILFCDGGSAGPIVVSLGKNGCRRFSWRRLCSTSQQCSPLPAHAGICIQRCRGSVTPVPMCYRVLLWPLVLSCAKQGAADCTGWPGYQCDQSGQSRYRAGTVATCTCTGTHVPVASCSKDGGASCKLLGHDWRASYSSDSSHVLQIEQLHQQVVEQVKTLYYSHRHLHGWQDRELEIV